MPNLSKHPIMLARSSSTGPPSSSSSSNSNKPFQLHKASSMTAPSTPASKKKILEKIPSISAHSESSEEDEEELEDVVKAVNNSRFINKTITTPVRVLDAYNAEEDVDDDDDDDDDEEELLHKRVSVIAHEFPNNTDWSPCGGGSGGGGISGNGHVQHAKNISTKMACGLRMCKATGRNLIKMLSTSSSSGIGGSNIMSTTAISAATSPSATPSSRRGSKFGCQTKPVADVVNEETRCHISSKVKFNYPFFFLCIINFCIIHFIRSFVHLTKFFCRRSFYLVNDRVKFSNET